MESSPEIESQHHRKPLKVSKVRRARQYGPWMTFVVLLGGFILPALVCLAVTESAIEGLVAIYRYKPIALVVPPVMYSFASIGTIRAIGKTEFRMTGFFVNGLACYAPLLIYAMNMAGPGIEIWDADPYFYSSLPLLIVSFFAIYAYRDWAREMEYQIYYEKNVEFEVTYL